MVQISKIIYFTIILALFIPSIPNNCFAIDPEEFLQDSQLELRARHISKNIRCMVCQNQSIDESASPLAKDLRILIRKKLTEGLTDKDIYKFLTDRYGYFILLNPALKKKHICSLVFSIYYFYFRYCSFLLVL